MQLFRDNLSHMGYSVILLRKEPEPMDRELFTAHLVNGHEPRDDRMKAFRHLFLAHLRESSARSHGAFWTFAFVLFFALIFGLVVGQTWRRRSVSPS